MESRKCLICYHDYMIIANGSLSKKKGNPDSYTAGADADCKILKSQMSVILLLRNFLDVPQEICTGFLQEFGSPSSWIYCCDSCRILVEKTERIFNQMAKLNRQFEEFRTELKNAIAVSIGDSQDSFAEYQNKPSPGIQKNPTDVVRSYIQNHYFSIRSQPTEQCDIKLEADEREFPIDQGELDPLNFGPPEMEKYSSEQLLMDMEERFDTPEMPDISSIKVEELDCYVPEYSPTVKKIVNDSQLMKSQPLPPLPVKKLKMQSTSGRNSLKETRKKFSSARKKLNREAATSSGNYNTLRMANPRGEVRTKRLARYPPGMRRIHSCSFCEKQFKTKTDKSRHERVHTGERPFECRFCDKAFRQLGQLYVHERTHTGEKPYSCSICAISFTQSYSIRRHMLIHTGEKPFSCTNCGKKYRDRNTLQIHRCTHHPSSTTTEN